MNSFRRKKDSFYVILKREYSFRWDSNSRSMGYEANSLPLSYLTRWWMGIKVAYIKSQIVCLQINQVYSIVTKWQIVNNIEQKCYVKTAATLALASTDHRCLLDKNVTRILPQEGILSVLKKIFFSSQNELKICEWRHVIIIGNRRSLLINIATFFRVCLGVIRVKKSVQWLLVKTLRSEKVVTVRKLEVGLNFDSIV